MNHLLVGLLAETHIHPGIGQNEGAIDLPVAREKVTDYPFIPGSGFKGALRDYVTTHVAGKEDDWFGQQENAGSILVGDARLLLLPVRSLQGNYKWITCRYILERLKRDIERAGIGGLVINLPDSPEQGKFYSNNGNYNELFLEERHLQKTDGSIETTALKKLIPDSDVANRLDTQLVLLHDADFAWFARNGLPVQARNVLDKETKASDNVWYEESLPPDTVMTALLSERVPDSGRLDEIKPELDNKWIQTGGNETVGQGWFKMKVVEGTS